MESSAARPLRARSHYTIPRRPCIQPLEKKKKKNGGGRGPLIATQAGRGGGGGSSAPATAPPSESVGVTVEDLDALDCGVCFLPLKPPIFQCDVGHIVCSLCRDKLQATGKCHVCSVATHSLRRCHGMERLVESIRVPCSYAIHGCALRPAYYDQENHRLVCEYAPCHCPGETCSFVGSTSALLDHCSTAHRWPCFSTVKADGDGYFTIRLHDGFNLLLADYPTGDTARIKCLLLLTVERQQLSRFISVHWIDKAAGTGGGGYQGMQCELWYSLCSSLGKSACLIDHYQISKFRVARTNLSNGLPKPGDCFKAVVQDSVTGDNDTDIQVKVRIVIN